MSSPRLWFALGLIGVACGSFGQNLFAQNFGEGRNPGGLRDLMGIQAESPANGRLATRDRQEPVPLIEPAPLPIIQGVQDPELTPGAAEGQAFDHFMRPIQQIRLGLSEGTARIPSDRSSDLQSYVTHDWTLSNMPELAYLWQAPNIYYGQLYFEDVALERYGQTCGPYRQVAHSGAHFFCSFCSWPIQGLCLRHHSCDTPLGYCRPGNCVNLYHQHFFSR